MGIHRSPMDSHHTGASNAESVSISWCHLGIAGPGNFALGTTSGGVLGGMRITWSSPLQFNGSGHGNTGTADGKFKL